MLRESQFTGGILSSNEIIYAHNERPRHKQRVICKSWFLHSLANQANMNCLDLIGTSKSRFWRALSGCGNSSPCFL